MKAVIAMSGGVDSSVAAYLTKKAGYECIGATMKLFHNEDAGIPREKSCCSLEDVEDARSVAHNLGMPYYVFNFSADFRKAVMDKFAAAYAVGATPNPCIDCNRYLKFEKLMLRARELNADYVVTGHYARIVRSEESGRYLLKKAADTSKDQSYVLYSLTQEQLARTLFPLGGMTKNEVRLIAEEQGFVNANKRDSQDICFVPEGSYADFIEEYTGKKYPEGDFVDGAGRVLGRHKGIIRYTVGQRKGLGLALPQPMYVCGIDIERNLVRLGTEEELYSRELIVRDINLISEERLEKPRRFSVRLRYRQKEEPAEVTQIDSDTLKIEFEKPQRAVTKGQAAVIYDGDIVVGGGVIA